MKWLNNGAPHVRSLLRIVVALLFMTHGAVKLFHFPEAAPGIPDPLPPLMLAAGILEVFGGGLVALGLFTRPVAFILSGEMAVAYFMAHAPQHFYPLFNGGESAVLFCFVFLYFVFAGPGPWSLDAIVRKKA